MWNFSINVPMTKKNISIIYCASVDQFFVFYCFPKKNHFKITSVSQICSKSESFASHTMFSFECSETFPQMFSCSYKFENFSQLEKRKHCDANATKTSQLGGCTSLTVTMNILGLKLFEDSSFRVKLNFFTVHVAAHLRSLQTNDTERKENP